MTTLTKGATGADHDATLFTTVRNVAVVTFLGLGLMWVAGFADADALHAAAHDTRHSTGFPCH